MPIQRSRDGWMVLIAVFKPAKGVLLIATAIGALRLLHKDVAEVVQHWIDVLRIDSDNRYIQKLLVKLVGVNDRTLKEISAGTFCYAALFFTEGAGLLFQKLWAQYFTVFVTGSFIPLEIYELMEHPSVAKALVILLNLAIIGYLVCSAPPRIKKRITPRFAVGQSLSPSDAFSRTRRFTHEEVHKHSIRRHDVTRWRVGVRRSSLDWNQNWSAPAAPCGLRGTSTPRP